MKKILFTAIALVAFAVSASAQYQSNIFGVRAGLNVSNLQYKGGGETETGDARVSFHVGISDQILLTRSLPLYLETGLYFTEKGTKESESDEGIKMEVNQNMMYLQVPLALTYHFYVTENIRIEPLVGVYYGLGVAGKAKVTASGYGESYTEKVDIFKKSKIYDPEEDENIEIDAMYKRSDFGMRFGVAASFGKAYLGLGYDLGLTNILKESEGDFKTKTRNFTVSLGYNF